MTQSRVVASLFLLLFAASSRADCMAPAWENRSTSFTIGNFFGRNTLAIAHFDNDAILDAVVVKPDTIDQVMLARGTGGGYFTRHAVP